jgi:predicted lipoprotein with Yx(FWY)xxD motif
MTQRKSRRRHTVHTPRTSAHASRRTAPGLLLAALALAGVAALVVAMRSSAAPAGTQVKAAKTSLGRVLVDGRGRTLYLFAIDKRGASSCSGQCAVFWPPLLAGTKSVAGSGVKASLLGTAKRAGGKLQVTYNGHPLYLFKEDAKAGQTKGEGLSFFGGSWWAVSTAGSAVKHAAATSAPPPAADPGYGSYGP